MLRFDSEQLTAKEHYKMLIGSIIPRPVALVTTLSQNKVLNAAPFSYFNIISSDPPMVSISVQRQEGKQKDTARNAAAAGEFVVHIADETYAEGMNATAAGLPSDESEVDQAGLTPIESTHVQIPGLAEAHIRMECKLVQMITLGGTDEKPAADLLIGRIVCYHISEELYDERGYIDPKKLKPLSRLAGNSYATLGRIFELQRPR
ncbi:flavin reductase family protein [Paenibacillus sp. JX-17]|uniref:Flavin reductase family protein n=1 Tax=Paenibacillus lacisoli TaxID=3064525 RepID=A0ABT9C7K0_9BACL|nr:flavin reductase family protein [Paenibacillus sp. JX-17]MDO7904870.1 flavin reductase family protein [Paenibacillus sp. JX-17]